METIDLIGLFGAFLSGVTFFPQVYRTWKLKSARELSLSMILKMSVPSYKPLDKPCSEFF